MRKEGEVQLCYALWHHMMCFVLSQSIDASVIEARHIQSIGINL